MSTCKTGKLQFDSWSIAQKAESHTRRHEDGRCQIYRCEFCGKWHLGRRFGRVSGKRPMVELREEA